VNEDVPTSEPALEPIGNLDSGSILSIEGSFSNELESSDASSSSSSNDSDKESVNTDHGYDSGSNASAVINSTNDSPYKSSLKMTPAENMTYGTR